jgi:TRAP-type mannitol/chloroaromatic compound transport system permease small subunit
MPSNEPNALKAVRQLASSLQGDPTKWGRLWNAYVGSVTSMLNAIGSVWIFGLMCMMLADLGMRFFFAKPISGVSELAGLSIVGIVYLQLASAVQGGRMVKADFLSHWLARRAPRLGCLLDALFQLLGALTMTGLAYVSLEPFLSSWVESENIGTAGVFLVATWPFRGLVLLGSSLAALCYLTLVVRSLAATITGETRND